MAFKDSYSQPHLAGKCFVVVVVVVVVDHDYLSQRAHEERKNRSQYKPIIDHDGIHREKSRIQVPDNIIISR
ncbi:hypothetical protein ACFX13_010844 [Malus domestica]